MNGAAVFFYALTKNQIVRIISIASYLTKKNWEKKLFVVADKSALWDTYFFSTQISSSKGLPELKIKQNYVQQIIVFLNETEEGE